MFKLIISPEFGDRLELEAHTRGLMERMEQHLGTELEWVAIVHRNTEHPHVHVALRGVDEKGAALRLPREFIKSGIRQHAEELATQQLGYRTQMDAEEAERREVRQARFTSLDRSIRKAGKLTPDGVSISVPDDLRSGYSRKRLVVLQDMGIAEQATATSWLVRANFEHILREMQKTTDRQKTLAAHRALMSDPNLPFQVTDICKVDHLRGRVLGHGEEESTGRSYMLLEGEDRKVHFIYHNSAIQIIRHTGGLNPNSTAVFRGHGLQVQFVPERNVAVRAHDKRGRE